MKIFDDENIPLMTVRALREGARRARHSRHSGGGMTDGALWELVERGAIVDHDSQTASKFGYMIQQRNTLTAWNAVHDN